MGSIVVPDTDVAIIGAGTTGLLLAQGLKTAGISFQIFERYEKDAFSREWSMSLHWGGEYLSKALPPDLRARNREMNTDPRYDHGQDTGFYCCNGETGETILVMEGMLPRRVSRRKMRSFMSQGLDIQHNKKLESIVSNEEFAIAKFADGSSVTAKLIVGCDGSRSKVREIMIGDKNVSQNIEADCTIINFPCEYPTEISKSLRDIHPTFKIGYHPKWPVMFFIAMADAESDDPSQWKHQLFMSWSGPPYATDLKDQAAIKKRIEEIQPQWAHPWSTATANIPEGTRLWADAGTYWDPRPHFKSEGGKTTWNGHSWNDRITVAGDAAHAMLPHRGQGLNNALQDASELVSALTSALKDQTKDLPSAIAAYEEEMVARGGLEVEVTGRQATASHNWDILMQSPIFKHGAHKATTK